jgi:hypothetical protein
MRAVASISVLGLLLVARAVCSCGSSEDLSVGDRSLQADASNSGPVADAKVFTWRVLCRLPHCLDASTAAALPACTAQQVSRTVCATPGVSCDPQVAATAGCPQFYEQCAANEAEMTCP